MLLLWFRVRAIRALADENFWLASKGCKSLWKHLNVFHRLPPVSTALSGGI